MLIKTGAEMKFGQKSQIHIISSTDLNVTIHERKIMKENNGLNKDSVMKYNQNEEIKRRSLIFLF